MGQLTTENDSQPSASRLATQTGHAALSPPMETPPNSDFGH